MSRSNSPILIGIFSAFLAFALAATPVYADELPADEEGIIPDESSLVLPDGEQESGFDDDEKPDPIEKSEELPETEGDEEPLPGLEEASADGLGNDAGDQTPGRSDEVDELNPTVPDQITAPADENPAKEDPVLAPAAKPDPIVGWWIGDRGNGYGHQRYWFENGNIVCDRLIKTGASSWAYARPEGYVVRGRWTHPDTGYVYLADNDGKLESPGWHVSDAYGQGKQRYWVESYEHACVPGWSKAGWDHFTLPEGFVARGDFTDAIGRTSKADNNGRVTGDFPDAGDGWFVTNKYGQGLQRYWFNHGYQVKSGLVDTKDGHFAYVRPEGYVVRGRWVDSSTGAIYLANNEGRLADVGWTCTNAYGHGLQRYWVDPDLHAILPGFSAGGWDHFTRSEGYVVRGRYTDPLTGYVYLADNNGRLENVGWLVTDKYGQGKQRYWVDRNVHACVPGYSTEGWNHYTMPAGYVARGSFVDSDGNRGTADNNGKVTAGFPPNFGYTGWRVTSEFGHGLQRYWFENGAVVKGKLIQTGASSWAYARPEGYVVRGRWVDSSTGYVYLADNNGKLENPGWLCSGNYGQGLQRYWIDSDKHACIPGFSADGWNHYTLTQGYVVRNDYVWTSGSWKYADNSGKLTPKQPNIDSRVEKYLSWAVGIAEDDSHGYSQGYPTRWGQPDYDCSSLVISAISHAGFYTGGTPGSSGASYTGNMRYYLTRNGWVWITDLSQMRRGDILLNESSHTVIYLGDQKIVGARISETGGIYGKGGDQTGKEICVHKYYSHPWDGFLRYVG